MTGKVFFGGLLQPVGPQPAEFLQKPDLLGLKVPAVQVFQSPGGAGEPEPQPVGAQRLIGEGQGLVLLVTAILAVSGQGVADRGHVCPDLVGPARQ